MSSSDTTLEQMIQSLSEVDDTSRLTALLQKMLVFEPQGRTNVSDVLDDPWFVSSPGRAASSGSASE